MKLEYAVSILLAVTVVLLLIGAVYGQTCTVVGPGERQWVDRLKEQSFQSLRPEICYSETALTCILEKGAGLRAKRQGSTLVYFENRFHVYIKVEEWEEYEMQFRKECAFKAGTK